MVVNIIDNSKITAMTMRFILPSAHMKKEHLGAEVSYVRSQRG